jgi:hypothetical protein
VSRRTKRRRGPQRSGGDSAAETGRAGEAREAAGGGRPGESRQPGRAASLGSSGEARRAGRGSGRGRPAPGAASRDASGWSLGVQLAFLVAVFAVVVLVAELAGAANLGVALGVGQIAFAIAVIYLLVRR